MEKGFLANIILGVMPKDIRSMAMLVYVGLGLRGNVYWEGDFC